MVRIPETLPPTASLTRPLGPTELLPVGKVLDAVVLQQRAGNLFELAAGDLRLMAETGQPLRPGEELRLRVTGRDASQRPTLQVQPSLERLLAPFLKALLPQQQDPTKLLAALWQLNNSGSEQSALQQAARTLDQLPSRQQFSDPAGLQRALQQSGLFLEAQLQRGLPVSPQNDLKALLLQLLRSLGGSQRGSPVATPASAGAPPPAGSAAAAAPPAGTATAAQAGTTAGRPAVPSDPITAYTETARANRLAAASRGSAANATASPASGSTAPTTSQAGAAPQTSLQRREPLPGQLQTLARAEASTLPPAGRAVEQLLQLTENTLARLETHQLLHLQSQSESHGPQWLLELPVRDKDGVDVWQLHIQRDDSHRDETEAEPHWHITLSFDFPGTGPVIARLEQQADKLQIIFYADRTETHELIEQRTAALQQALQARGISSVDIQHHQGLPHPDTLPHELHSVLEDQA